MSTIEIFNSELDLIKDSKVLKVVKDVLDAAPSYFYDPKCWSSSSGKYHLQTDGMERENLIDHTKRVVIVLRHLLDNPVFSNNLTDKDKDICLGACILHDCCKRGLDPDKAEHTKFTHPLLVKELVNNLNIYSKCGWDEEMIKIFFEINELIESHSGLWTTSKYSSVVLPEPKGRKGIVVHLSDYIASRNGFNIKVPKGNPVVGECAKSVNKEAHSS